MAAIVLASAAARGQEGRGPIVTARLVPAFPALVPGEPFPVALVLTAPPGWHTYWRNPGDAGAATTLDWRLPQGFTAGALRWPAPTRFVTGPIVSYGYAGETWLLATLATPADLKPGATVPLAATAEWLACADICVPEQATLTLNAPVVATAGAPPPAPAFKAAEARLPRPLAGATFRVVDGEARVFLPGLADKAAGRVWFFPDEDGVIDDGAAQRASSVEGGLVLAVPLANPKAPSPSRLAGVVVAGSDILGVEASARP